MVLMYHIGKEMLIGLKLKVQEKHLLFLKLLNLPHLLIVNIMKILKMLKLLD